MKRHSTHFCSFFPFSFRTSCLFSLSMLLCSSLAIAQTPTDGLMMSEGNICVVGMYSHDSWKNYWEGQLKRENLNIGTLTTQSATAMAALGITNKLNAMVSLPYIWTSASAGTMRGQRGVQDVSVNLKWKALEKQSDFGKLSLFAVAGFSLPASNYTPDFLPLSIGAASRTGSVKGVVHYRAKFGAFITAQAGYTVRDNIKLDRNSYYTDHLIVSNEVTLPNIADGSIRAGYLVKHLIVEAILGRFTTLSGHDIRRNDMPFPSNMMQATRLGISVTYRPQSIKGLSFQTGVNCTTHGRNVGQSTTAYGGILYIIQLWKKSPDAKDTFFQNNN